jgi:hypothetical protein
MAAASLAGIDPRIWLRTESMEEVALLDRIATRAIEMQRDQRQEQADRIILALDKALKKGKSRKGSNG